ncbi:methylated-DNA--[protein]-cysteine S-methyltransferase [Paenibacillus oenotherae]|uniref:Methylated-DNA--protein-cysteine methyltransferase n=2 Tax=Paenibacillus oenotherae TaxID=1435645 RepID=A0ABS7D4V2_9BACL|nr:methylated-DNA--[protein]-cysteine S-methyltransferase [Paenibacillus oenotherae]
MSWREMASPIGPLVLLATDQGLCHIDFGGYASREEPLRKWAAARGIALAPAWQEDPEHPVIREAAAQLERYFAGELTAFNVQLDMRGTPFQLRVWEALLDVPYGEVCSYKHIAEAIGQPKAVRAVGGANNRNPLPLIVPCHRVIGASGDMVGYGGGLNIKTYLLQHERTDKKG